jgi:hypothetical protein
LRDDLDHGGRHLVQTDALGQGDADRDREIDVPDPLDVAADEALPDLGPLLLRYAGRSQRAARGTAALRGILPLVGPGLAGGAPFLRVGLARRAGAAVLVALAGGGLLPAVAPLRIGLLAVAPAFRTGLAAVSFTLRPGLLAILITLSPGLPAIPVAFGGGLVALAIAFGARLPVAVAALLLGPLAIPVGSLLLIGAGACRRPLPLAGRVRASAPAIGRCAGLLLPWCGAGAAGRTCCRLAALLSRRAAACGPVRRRGRAGACRARSPASTAQGGAGRAGRGVGGGRAGLGHGGREAERQRGSRHRGQQSVTHFGCLLEFS